MSAVASRWKSRASLRAWLALLLAGVVATAAARAAELAPRTETFPGDYQLLRLTAGAVWPNPDAKAKAPLPFTLLAAFRAGELVSVWPHGVSATPASMHLREVTARLSATAVTGRFALCFGEGTTKAGLHKAGGGSGELACSADMLLEVELAKSAAYFAAAALDEVMQDLAQQVVRDGEGAQKLISVEVKGAANDASARRIGLARYAVLTEKIREVLAEAIEAGGSSLRDYVNSEGEAGFFQDRFFVYGREGEGCLNCKTKIRGFVLGQRATFYCPRCQR